MFYDPENGLSVVKSESVPSFSFDFVESLVFPPRISTDVEEDDFDSDRTEYDYDYDDDEDDDGTEGEGDDAEEFFDCESDEEQDDVYEDAMMEV